MFAWLPALVLVVSPPDVALARGSACAPRELLARGLSRLGVSLVNEAPLQVRLTPRGAELELVLEREGVQVLRRTLRGTCDDAAVATAVVIERFLRDIGSIGVTTIAERPAAEPSDAGLRRGAVKPPPERAVRIAAQPPDGGALTSVPEDAGLDAQKQSEADVATPLEAHAKPPPERAVRIATQPPDRGALTPVPEDAGLDAQKQSEAEVATESHTNPPPANDGRREDAGLRAGAVDAGVVVASLSATPDGGLESTLRATWTVLAGGGLLLPATGVLVTPIISLEPQVRVGAWRASLLAVYSNGGSTPVVEQVGATEVTRGRLAARDALLTPSLGYCSQGRVEVCGALLAGLRLVFASASGALIFQASSGVAGAFLGGASGDVTVSLGTFRVSVGVALFINPQPTRVALEGLSTILVTPYLGGAVRLSVGMGSAHP